MCSARRVEYGPSGEVVFAEEEPIFVTVNLRVLESSTGRPLHYWRVEAKTENRQHGACPGETLVVTEAPYGNGWFATAAFKRGRKRHRSERTRVAAVTLEEAQQEIEAGASDPWETGNYLTAGIAVPETLNKTLRSYGGSAKWVFGICNDAAKLRDEIAGSERARHLLSETLAHRLRIVRPSPSGVPVAVPLNKCVAEEAGEILLLSISQALAGPADVYPTLVSARRLASDAWVGRPVMDLVDRIYRDHLHNLARTYERRQRQEVVFEE